MKKTAISIFLILFSIVTYGQAWKLQRLEVYGGLTTFHYFGDIGGSADKSNWFGIKDISIRSTRPGFSAGVVFRLDEKIYAKADLSLGVLASTDRNSVNYLRGHSFSTITNEISIRGLYFIIPESNQNYYYSVMQLRGGLRKLNQPFSLYAFFGVGSAFYSVFPNQSLKSDPRFNDNSSFAMLFPVGIGAKMAFIPRISFGAELSARYVLSDYLDGFTTKKSKYNDVYYLFNFNVYYRFPRAKHLKGLTRR